MRMTMPRLTSATAALLTCALPPSVWAAEAPLTATLDRVPAGAEVVLVVPSMDQLSEKIAAFGRATGLDATAPDLADALGSFKRQMGLVEGVDDAGALVIVVNGLTRAMATQFNDIEGDEVEPSALLLVPTSDYAALVSQLGGDGNADASAVTLADSQGFARRLEGFAVMGQTMEEVQAYQPARQGQAMTGGLGGVVSRYLTTGDSFIYLDIKAMATQLNQAIDSAKAEMDEQMQANQGQMRGMDAMTRAMMNLYESYARTLVNGSDKVVFSLDLSDAGLGLTSSVQMVEGSKLAAFFKPGDDAKSTAAQLLSSLPDEPYLYASAVDARAFDLAGMIDSVIAAMGEGGEAGMFAAYRDALEMMKRSEAVASVFYAPDAAALMGGSFMKTLTVYDTADAKAFAAQQQAAIEKLAGMKVALPAAEGEPAQEVAFSATYTPKALVIEGVEVDQYQTQTVLPPSLTADLGPMAMVMNGFTQASGYLAVKNDKVLMTTVPDAQLITRGLQAVDQSTGIGAAGAIAELRGVALPPNASMEFYFSVGGLMQSVSPFLMMFAPEAGQVQTPADLPPLAMGAGAEGNGAAFRFFLPTDLVTFGVNTANALAPQESTDTPAGRRAPRAY